jgi:tetratricopeptide (TPR) repeat protein
MICPTQEELRLLLTEDLAGPDAAALEAHVESCAICQRTLEELTSGTAPKPEASSQLSSVAEQTWVSKSGSEFLRQLEGTPPDAPTVHGFTGAEGSDHLPRAATATLQLPTVAGYSMVRELGRGGMGVVYLAWQTKLNRRVALKMILAGSHAGPEQLERFRLEAEVVARLQHPNIVQIHAVGEQDGLPFFSLEYVEGVSLPRFLAGTPQPAREAAHLVCTLARAVDYAHERGVVHRDLKPANILLGGLEERRGQGGEETETERPKAVASLSASRPKIADFGLAKRLDMASGQTRSGDIMGTPSYMAPEQASGRVRAIGPAVDIYALGAILYEMLTGRPPFKAETPAETIRQVLTEEPVRPTRLQRKVPYDIETICLQCLQKEPARRYVTAAALAEDLERFLNGQPIKARPTPWWEQGLKWGKRRPALAGLVAVTVLAALALLGGGLWYNARLQAALQEAEANFRLARQAVDDYSTKVSEDKRLKENFRPLRKELLETVVPFYEQFVAQHGEDPGLQSELARACMRLGAITQEIGDQNKAISSYQQAVSRLVQLTRSYPLRTDYQLDLARCYGVLGPLYQATGNTGNAERAIQEALQMRQRLAEQQQGDAAIQSELAASYDSLGELYRSTAKTSEAETAFLQALAIGRKLVEQNPGFPQYQRDLANSHCNLAILYRDLGILEKSEKAHQDALILRRQLAEQHPEVTQYQSELADSCHNLGVALSEAGGIVFYETGKMKDAVKAYDEAIAISRRLATQYPEVPKYRDGLARSLDNRGNAYRAMRDLVEAKKSQEEAYSIFAQLAKQNPEVVSYAIDLGGCCANLGHLDFRMGQMQRAIEWHTKAIASANSVLHKEPREVWAREMLSVAHEGRAKALSMLGRHAEALQDCDRALEFDNGRDRDAIRLTRAQLLARAGDFARALDEANDLAQAKSLRGGTLYDLAGVYSLSCSAIRRDVKMSQPDTTKRADETAHRALDMLARARDAGFFKDQGKIEEMKKDSSLDPLRGRDDFQKLVAALKGKGDRAKP